MAVAKSHQLINQDSGNTEYFTPQYLVEAARAVMGGIDLDPFSSEAGNDRVAAKKFFTEKEDGLSHHWHGRTWMNHPFGRRLNKLCIDKLIQEYAIGNVSEACCITFASTSELWFQPLLHHPQCFLSPRTNFILPNGRVKKGVTKGSVITYLGGNYGKFFKEFSRFGVVKVPMIPKDRY